MKTLLLLILTVILYPKDFGFSAEAAEDIVFIVNADNPVTQITHNEVRDYYFKRKRVWPNSESVRFIDRNVDNQARRHFVKNILKKSNSEVEQFWIGQKLYTGDSAPLRETSDAGTIKFCSSFKGSIGYISAQAAETLTNTTVKIIKLEKVGD